MGASLQPNIKVFILKILSVAWLVVFSFCRVKKMFLLWNKSYKSLFRYINSTPEDSCNQKCGMLFSKAMWTQSEKKQNLPIVILSVLTVYDANLKWQKQEQGYRPKH